MLQRWRERLSSLSWFMRVFNETLARRANLEDDCKGRFWEGRFRCQALLDDVGLLACMAYVDLNPIRAGLAPTPEASEYTSIEQRIQALLASSDSLAAASAPVIEDQSEPATRPHLMPFMPEGLVPAQPNAQHLPYQLQDYLELLDWAGRVVRPGKRGAISTGTPAILVRLALEPERFRVQLQSQFSFRGAVVARRSTAKNLAGRAGRKFFKGVLFGPPVALNEIRVN